MNRMLRPARKEHAGPTPSFLKKKLPKSLCMERTGAVSLWLLLLLREQSDSRESGSHARPEQVVAGEDGRSDRRIRSLEVAVASRVSDSSRSSRLGTTHSRMHWKAQKMPGKYSAAPIVGPIQCVDGELPVQPKMLRSGRVSV